VLAIELRLSRFAYAVYEGPRHLLDWGGRACPTSRGANLAAQRVAELLRLFHPAVLVIKKDCRGAASNKATVERIAARIRGEASIRSIPFSALCPEEVRQVFSRFDVETKDDVAAVLTGMFPELLWELPRRRRKWDNEHPRMAVFDSIALGFAYFERRNTRT
jgi:hypothetical protein